MKKLFMILLICCSFVQADLSEVDKVLKLTQLLQSDRYSDRIEAAQKLGKIKNPLAVSALLVAHAKETDEYARHFQRRAIEKTGKPAIPALLCAVRDHDAKVRMLACRSLENIDDPVALLTLQINVKIEKDKDVKKKMQEVIANWEKRAVEAKKEEAKKEGKK